MERSEIEIVEVELKYCERCGGLWVRPRGSERVLCASCAPKMAELTIPSDRVKVLLPADDGEVYEATLEEFAALCNERGNA